MIEIKDDTKEKCQDCPMFSPETTCNKFYGDNKVVKTVVQIYCENRNNCGAVLRYDTTEDMKTENVKSFLANCVEAYKREQQYIICPQCKNKIVLNAVR